MNKRPTASLVMCTPPLIECADGFEPDTSYMARGFVVNETSLDYPPEASGSW